MRILVAPHALSIGGSQINAIDLAAGVAAAGHEVIVYGRPGPLEDRIAAHGLEFVAARRLRYRPAPSRITQLTRIARRRRLDLIHAYEWPPCLDAYFGAHLLRRVPLLCTVLSMSVSPLVPDSIPLIMGTEALGEEARRSHSAPVWVLEPPIDTDANHPAVEGAHFRRAHRVPRDGLLVVTVSRLANDLKLDALVQAIDAVKALSGRLPIHLVLVGGGEAEPFLRARARSVNAGAGRDVVRFAGELADPRTAYAAADVVVGMGSSALRAMSMGRPVIVQGERGFSEIFGPETLGHFLLNGFWGTGDGQANAELLARQLRSLLADPAWRAELGAFGRSVVQHRFSLERAVARQLEIYAQVHELGRAIRPTAVAVAAGRALRLEVENHNPRRRRLENQVEASLPATTGWSR
jgi:glycosyltransferase involved in cell wall biosynthesis